MRHSKVKGVIKSHKRMKRPKNAPLDSEYASGWFLFAPTPSRYTILYAGHVANITYFVRLFENRLRNMRARPCRIMLAMMLVRCV